ncbi:hypothetical protein AaE_012637, partial [Aphanomyces astaci]
MAFADGKERVLPSSSSRRDVTEKYKAILQPKSSVDIQPQHVDRVFKRMLTQHKTVDTTSKWTNRFVASSTEMAFQTWSVAFYSTSARTLMLCVVLVHMLVTTVDFTFSQVLHRQILGNVRSHGAGPVVVHCDAGPLYRTQTKSRYIPRLAMVYAKWIIALAMVMLCTGLMVRTGCIYEVNLHTLHTKYMASVNALVANDPSNAQTTYELPR